SSSIHFTYENLLEDPRKPWILMHPHSAQSRLGLLGIQPGTPVVVIGYGTKRGHGEEGRLAWALLYYGINDVQTVSIDGMDVYFTHQETPQPTNSEVWSEPVREQFVISRDDFIRAATSPRQHGKHSVFIIDARSKDEYFNRTGGDSDTPDLRALQIN